MEETKHYCQNCGAKIKSTDAVCSNCGKNLKEVGRRIVVTVVETFKLSDEVEAKLTKKQISIIKKVFQTIKNELAKKEIESITFGFPQFVSITIKNKKDAEGKVEGKR